MFPHRRWEMFVNTNAGLGPSPAPPPQGEDWLLKRARGEGRLGEIQAFPSLLSLEGPWKGRTRSWVSEAGQAHLRLKELSLGTSLPIKTQ